MTAHTVRSAVHALVAAVDEQIHAQDRENAADGIEQLSLVAVRSTNLWGGPSAVSMFDNDRRQVILLNGSELRPVDALVALLQQLATPAGLDPTLATPSAATMLD